MKTTPLKPQKLKTTRLYNCQYSSRFSVQRERSQQGFTLIEIIVALAIVSIAVVSIVDAMGKHTYAASELEKRILASWVASNYIAEIRHESKTDRVKSGGDSEIVKMGGLRWRVKSKIRETEVERVFLVEVEVKDEARRAENPLVLMTTALTDRL